MTKMRSVYVFVHLCVCACLFLYSVYLSCGSLSMCLVICVLTCSVLYV